MNSEHNNKRQYGFTLIEVLISLAVIAIALGAILSTSGHQASQVTYLKQKTIAHWVAMNELTQLQVIGDFPDLGTTDGSTNMASNEWFWKRTVKKTEDDKARQVEYEVYADSRHENNLTRLVGYVNQ